VIVPRTFPTPLTPLVKISNPVYEAIENEKKVEFDMARNTAREGHGNDTFRIFSSGPWIRSRDHHLRERERERERSDLKERDQGDTSVKERKDNTRDRKDGRKELKDNESRKGLPREFKKGSFPPATVLHGYKHPKPPPKSILKRAESEHVQSFGIIHPFELYISA